MLDPAMPAVDALAMREVVDSAAKMLGVAATMERLAHRAASSNSDPKPETAS